MACQGGPFLAIFCLHFRTWHLPAVVADVSHETQELSVCAAGLAYKTTRAVTCEEYRGLLPYDISGVACFPK